MFIKCNPKVYILKTSNMVFLLFMQPLFLRFSWNQKIFLLLFLLFLIIIRRVNILFHFKLSQLVILLK